MTASWSPLGWGVALSEAALDSEVWAWSAGTSWAPSDLSVWDNDRVVVDHLAWGDGLFLAAGAIVPEQHNPDALWTPRVWQSTDGRVWREVAAPAEDVRLCALEGDTTGGFVGVGMAADATAVWRWRDGAWHGVPLPSSPGHSGRAENAFMNGCAVVGLSDRTGVILARDDGTRAWWSVDAASWAGGDSLSSQSIIHVAGRDATVVLALTEYGPSGEPTGTVMRTGSIP